MNILQRTKTKFKNNFYTLKRNIDNINDNRFYAYQHTEDYTAFSYKISECKIHIMKQVTEPWRNLQRNNIHNIYNAGRKLHGVLIRPQWFFSFWKTIGKPGPLRGFVKGLGVQDGKVQAIMGSGIEDLSDALSWCAIHSGLEIIERHSHDYLYYSDDQRNLPFGTGACVKYNFKDLVFENQHDFPIMISCQLDPEYLTMSLLSNRIPDFEIEIIEKEPMLIEKDDGLYRYNKIIRNWRYQDGSGGSEILYENKAKVLYNHS